MRAGSLTIYLQKIHKTIDFCRVMSYSYISGTNFDTEEAEIHGKLQCRKHGDP